MNDFIAQIKDDGTYNMVLGPNDHEDGIYFGMPEDEYHRDTALGASGIVDLNISPLAFYQNSAWAKNRVEDEKDEKETAATIRGTYFHEALAAAKPTIIVKPAGMSFATTDGKAFKAKHPGATFIKAEDTERAQLMIDALRETGALEFIGGIGGGISEVAFFYTDKQGRRRKMKFDRLFNGQAFDWKTMANRSKKDLQTLVAHVVAEHRYHIKAFWYQTGLQVMKQMVRARGADAIMTPASDQERAAVIDIAASDAIVPFWYVFIENSGVPNVVGRRFVSHDAAGQLNAYFRGAKQECERALKTFDTFMKSHGPDKPWFEKAVFKDFADEDFTAARWILADD